MSLIEPFFVDQRVGCVAVRKRANTDPEYQGLHYDTHGVVWYRHGVYSADGWNVRPEDAAEARRVCAEMNASAAEPHEIPAREEGSFNEAPNSVEHSEPVERVIEVLAKPGVAEKLIERLQNEEPVEWNQPPAPTDAKGEVERLRDLVRHQRAELHEVDLISDEEYAALAMMGKDSVARLESYDAMRRQIADLTTQLTALREAAEGEWKPIETSPKNGSRFLAWRDGEVFTVSWYPPWEGSNGLVLGGQSWHFADWSFPTHWRPELVGPHLDAALAQSTNTKGEVSL
jgi:hypothetical protein